MKEYNNLTDLEKNMLREYDSWKKSNAPFLYKLSMLERLHKRLRDLKISHLL